MAKLKIEYRPTARLVPYAKNARTHSSAQIDQIANSIRSFGFNNPVLIDENDGIVAGHGRVMAAQELGLDEVPCIRLGHLSDRERRAYIIADNQIALKSGWDIGLLSEELNSLAELELDLGTLGFDEQELDALLKLEADLLPDGFGGKTVEVAGHTRHIKDGLIDDDEVPEPAPAPVSRRGDVWMLGEHRVMCGDSTLESDVAQLMLTDVAQLMLTDVAQLMLTDPPYGVAYVGKTGEALTIKNDALTEEQTHQLWKSALDGFWSKLENGAVIYATVPTGPLHIGFANELKVRDALRQIMVWDKKVMVLGHSDYHYRHEPILYGWKPGKAHYFINDRTKTTVFEYQKPSANRLHPTMKPVDLWVEMVVNSSRESDVVVDMFGGSGTTLIACEKTARCARVMELDERYVDVIVKRWQDFTGKKVYHYQTNQSFDEIAKQRVGESV